MSNTSAQIDQTLAQLKQTLTYLEQAATTVNRGPGGREIALAKTALQEAGHWLKDAKEIVDTQGGSNEQRRNNSDVQMLAQFVIDAMRPVLDDLNRYQEASAGRVGGTIENIVRVCQDKLNP